MLVGASRIRCLVVDDHAVVRAGLIRLLEREEDIEIAGDAEHAEGVLSLIERRRPHVAIIDLHLPPTSGIDLCREVLAAHPATRVVVFTGSDDPEQLEQALEAGASGYVLKTSPLSDLVRALRLVQRGHTYVDATLAAGLVRRRTEDRGAGLSPREREVLQLLAEGLTTDSVATRLFLSPTTVRSYAEGAMQKLEGRNRTHAVAQALRRELIH